ncbi:hypothetical protein Vretimale_18795, partial [Volvox reticuliferus]
MKLAEGAIGDVNMLPEGTLPPQALQHHPLRVVAIDTNPEQSTSFARDGTAGAAASGAAAGGPHSGGFGAGASATAAGHRRGLGSNDSLSRTSSDGIIPVPEPVTPGRHVPGEVDGGPTSPQLHGEVPGRLTSMSAFGSLAAVPNAAVAAGASVSGARTSELPRSVVPGVTSAQQHAAVTDTTTFTSEKRRQQEEQWLYETCTRCLQHLVDLFVQFYDEAFTLLSRLLDLLRGFMNRSHQSLAAVGVAAFVRLAVKAGPIMNETCWEEVIAALLAILEETAPEARDLITPPPRLNPAVAAAVATAVATAAAPISTSVSSAISSEITPASGSGSPSGGPSAHHPPTAPSGAAMANGGGGAAPVGAGGRTFTLREGVGARRLAKFRCQAATQLLLVQGCSEIYANASQSLPPGAVRGLLDALAFIHRHAHAADMDMDLRRRLAVQQ